ncbi:hypothetical protein [Neobacillus vireti]
MRNRETLIQKNRRRQAFFARLPSYYIDSMIRISIWDILMGARLVLI